MKNKFGNLGIKEILIILITGIIVLGLGALIFWGIGNLIIWVFKIDFIWTFWHGLAIMFVYLILKEIFSGGNKQ